MNSLIIPVYKNEKDISSLLESLSDLNRKVLQLEVIFVVDGSPDNCAKILKEILPNSGLNARLVLLSRNFGSFAAIRVGLEQATGQYFAVMAADQQEPPELIIRFFELLNTDDFDIVIGTRQARNDPLITKMLSATFWRVYAKFVAPEIPVGGVDVFGCNSKFRNELLKLDESHSSLVALLFWMGFRREIISYDRLPRQNGKSAWTFKSKIKYFKDSIFSFTDAPIRLLTMLGVIGLIFSLLMSIVVVIGRTTGWINLPGYSATVLTIVFFGALNVLGLGIVGTYAWRTYENTKGRPLALIMQKYEYSNSSKTVHQ